MEKIEYYPYMDTLKGIAIILMVMGHVIPWTIGDPAFLQEPLHLLSGKELNSAIIYKIIYSFHMQLLFFVSGFLFYKPCDIHNSTWLMKTCKKRVHRILLPYFVSGSLLWICRGQWGYWFLQCLFFFNVICALSLFVIYKMRNYKYFEIIVYILTYICLLYINRHCGKMEEGTNGIVVVGRLYQFFPSFLLGIILRKYHQLDKVMTNKYFVLCCLLLYCFIFVNSQIKEFPLLGLMSTIMLPLSMIIYMYSIFKAKINLLGGEKSILLEKTQWKFIFFMYSL